MNLNVVLKSIKKIMDVRKKVDLDEYDLHFELGPVTNSEEAKILESIKELESSLYMEGLKRHSLACSIKKITFKNEAGVVVENDLQADIIEYEDEDGSLKKKSKFLYMVDFLKGWPSSLIDSLFAAHNDLHAELDDMIKRGTKFEKYAVSAKLPPEKLEKLKQPESEEVSEEELDDAEKLKRQVDMELEREEAKIANAER